MNAATLIENLRQRIDPVFLPRPLLLVDRLPRNATGKLPQQALQALADQHLQAHGSPQGVSRDGLCQEFRRAACRKT